MEKLVKLLNEYVGQDSYWIDEYDNGAFITWGDGDQCFIDEHIISKNFGFIKWLVDNNKIRKSYKEGLPAITKNGFLLEGDTVLLMLLSISDTQIDDLISYLK